MLVAFGLTESRYQVRAPRLQQIPTLTDNPNTRDTSPGFQLRAPARANYNYILVDPDTEGVHSLRIKENGGRPSNDPPPGFTANHRSAATAQVTFTLIARGLARSCLGRVTVSTPCAKSACTPSSLTVSGKVKERAKAP